MKTCIIGKTLRKFHYLRRKINTEGITGGDFRHEEFEIKNRGDYGNLHV